MTYREWLVKNSPKNVNAKYKGGCFGCPDSYDPAAPCICLRKNLRPSDLICTACWDQEIPKTEASAKEDKPSRQKIVFLSGPITGVEKYWEAFEKAMDELSGNYIVLNPAQLPQGMTNEKYTRICMAMIDSADAVFMLPGWERSKGANLEAQYCDYIGKPWTSNKARLEEVLR
jgi:hypothetical protein